MKDTTAQGDIAEWQVAAALIRDGRKLLRPVSGAARYDLVVDNQDGTFTRIQCKAGRLRNGRIEFRVYSMSGHRGTRGRTYSGQIDAFGVYCPSTGESYLVPMTELAGHARAACLRVAVAKNGQSKRIRLARDYVIGRLS